MIGCEALAQCAVEKYGLRRDLSVSRQLSAELRLYKSIRTKEVVESREGLESRGSRSEASRSVAARHQHPAK